MQNNLSTTADSLPATFYDATRTSPTHVNRGSTQELPYGWWVPIAILFAFGFWGSVLWWLFS